MQGLKGKDIGVRPSFWEPYEGSKARALQRSRPIAALLDHYRDRAAEMRQLLAAMHADATTSRFLPAMARTPWVAVLDADGNVRGYLPLDGFF